MADMHQMIPARATPMSARRTSMVGAVLTMLGPFSLSIYTPAMPVLAEAFQTSDSAIKLSLSMFFGGFAFAILVSGPVSDAFGRRRAAMLFLSVYMIGSLLCAFAGDINMLLVGRLIQGIGASVGLTLGRVIVRDQFTGEPAARIMNAIGIILAVGPAIAPSLGGLILHFFDWKAIFLAMIGFGCLQFAMVWFVMAETTVPDRAKAHPLPLLRAYGRLVRSPHFMAASLLIATSAGTLYALASILPFVLIKVAGLTPAEFGIGMLLQTGCYTAGTLVFRAGLRWTTSRVLLRVGIVAIACGATATVISVAVFPISYLSVMLPVGCSAFAVAFVLPYAMNAGLLPFPDIAGSASAGMGFMQIGAGFVAGLAAASLGSPVLGFQIIMPVMGAIAITCFFWLTMRERRDQLRADRIQPAPPPAK